MVTIHKLEPADSHGFKVYKIPSISDVHCMRFLLFILLLPRSAVIQLVEPNAMIIVDG
jgi:hypothetical protein